MFRHYKKYLASLKTQKEIDDFQFLVMDEIIEGSTTTLDNFGIHRYFKTLHRKEIYGPIYQRYLDKIYPHRRYKKNRIPFSNICTECYSDCVHDFNTCVLVCSNCGVIQKHFGENRDIVDSSRHNRFDVIVSYKKEDHLNRCLDKIKKEDMSLAVKSDIRKMFLKIKNPLFHIYRGKRSNFLNYPYVIRKIIQIRKKELPSLYDKDYSKYFKKLNNKKRVKQHDALWCELCKKCNIKFYYTI